jgi:hypothetical protein
MKLGLRLIVQKAAVVIVLHNEKEQYTVLISDVDRHRFDADPEPTLYFDVVQDSDPNPDPSLSFTHVGNQKKFFDFYSQQSQS